MKKRMLDLNKVRLDGDTQPRAGINTALVSEYAQLYEDGAELPPVVVFFDGVDYWLADGFHRWHARNKTGIEGISCEIHNGTVEDARWWSYAANQAHGQRRSNADKQKAAKAALLHPKGAGLSDHQIAEHVGVSYPFVGKLRKELEESGQLVTVTSRIGSDGRTIDTTNIGGGARAADSQERGGRVAIFCRRPDRLDGGASRVSRSNADKQKAAKAALLHPKGAGLSDHQIAEHVGVSYPFVGKLRKELEESGQLVTVTSRIGSDGRTIDTTNIGGGAAADEEPDDTEEEEPEAEEEIEDEEEEEQEGEEEEEEKPKEKPKEKPIATKGADELELFVRKWIDKHRHPLCIAVLVLENLARKLGKE